jgi:hypothetical protein
MLAYLSSLEIVIPTFMAVLALVLFTEKTKWLSFATILLAIVAEMLLPHINIAALIACISCLAGVVFINYLRTNFDLRFNLASKQ